MIDCMVSILGAAYEILFRTEDQDARLKDCDGYSDWTVRHIVVDDFSPDHHSWEDIESYKKKVLRHEIVHAFFFESGLHECSTEVKSWAKNEEMVDWIARQHEKLHKAFEEAGAL
jgi:hypothetical protein